LYGEGEVSVLLDKAEAEYPAGAFIICPPALSAGPIGSPEWILEIYRIALEQAQATVWPTPFERAGQVSEN
jgi:hypothetical protein